MQRPLVTSAFFLCILIQSVSCGWHKRCIYLPVQRYIQFHTQQRGRPEAKYIIYTCKEHGCYGIGDRVRAVIFLGRLAAATGRVLLVDWTFPTSLDTYLQPSLVNWSIKGLAIPEHHHRHHSNSSVSTDASTSLESNHEGSGSLESRRLLRTLHSDQPSSSSTDDAAPSSAQPTSTGPHSGTDSSSVHSSMYIPLTDTVPFLQHLASKEAFEAAYGNVTYLRIQTNLPAQHPLPWLPQMDMSSVEPVCWWAALFQPSEALTQGVDKALEHMYGSSDPADYVAIHLRMGNLLHEDGAMERDGDRVQVLAASLQAARWLAYEHDLDMGTTPALLVTDSRYLRAAASWGFLSGVVSPAGYVDVPHSDFSDRYPAAHMQAFIELGLLARARCLIMSESGFSVVASWWGGQQCQLRVVDAVQKAEEWLASAAQQGKAGDEGSAGGALPWEGGGSGSSSGSDGMGGGGGGEEDGEEEEDDLEALVSSWHSARGHAAMDATSSDTR